MNLELLTIYLKEWQRRSDRFKGGPKGFPRRSLGFSSGGYQKGLDEFQDDSDDKVMIALDTIIYEDLPEAQRICILVLTQQMPNVFKTNRRDLNMEELLDISLRAVWSGLLEKVPSAV
jgi:hypothetical protein